MYQCRNGVKIVTSQLKCSKEPQRTFYITYTYVQWRSTLVLYFCILIFASLELFTCLIL